MHPLVVNAQREQVGLFTTAQAIAAGYSANEISALIRSSRWIRVRRGVMTTPEFVDETDLRAYIRRVTLADCLCIGAAAVASHRSAALEHSLWMLGPPETITPAITLPPGSLSASATSHVYRATLDDVDRWTIGPLSVTSPARTVVDLARHLPFEEAVAIADSALNRRLVEGSRLLAVLERCTGWPGWRRAAAVLEFADGRTQSPYESLARVRCAQHGLPTPQPQAAVRGSDGRTYWVDLYWERERTIGEIDGKIKYRDREGNDPEQVRWEEKQREDRLREAGNEVIRMTPAQIEHAFDGVRDRLQAAFARALRRAS